MSNTFTKPADIVAGVIARAGDINDRVDATETGFDNVEAITNRSIKLPVGTSGDIVISESGPNRALKEVGFDADGDLILISSAFQWKGDWTTSTAYIKNDIVRDSSTKNIYAVQSDHTSGVLATDISGAKLSLAINVADVETAKTAAQTAQTAAELAETNAETAETNAETAETNAETAETNAATSATSASASASTATTKASTATTQAATATTEASAAASSATSAAASETNAAASETNAASSASTASTQATNAASSASAASTSASAASTSATSAASSATSASTSETNAASSATSASTSATSAAASYDTFDDRMLGAKSSDPTLDNDGDALLTGAIYFNTSDNVMKAYNGSTWAVTAPSAANQTNIDIVAGNIVYSEDLGSIATAVTTSSGNSISTVGAAITNINTVAGAVANINTVGAGIANVNTVAGNASNITTVAGSIADVNRYANEYAIAASAPASPSAGDLWFDTSANILKYYTGSTWGGIISGITDVVSDTTPQLGGALDGQNNNMTNIGTVSGSNLQIDFGGLT